jgi:heptosyltransferase-2
VCHEDAAWARERLSAAGLSGVSLLGVHTGSGGARKNWPIQMFRRVAESWLSLPGRGLVLTVGPVEEEARKEALDLPANAQTLVLQGEPLPRVAAMLARCAAFIGNDSGITHLAAAVGAPTLAVFGPTDPALWAPRGKAVRVVGPVRGGGFPGLAEALDALRSLVP